MEPNRYGKIHSYRSVKRLLARIFAIAFWLISIYFSQLGFGFRHESALATIFGFVLGCGVTVLELFANEDGANLNPTLLIACLFAYGYGIWTNIVGIAAWSGVDSVFGSLLSNPGAVIMPITLGVILEIVPEPLLLRGMDVKTGDLIGQLMEIGNRHDQNNTRTSQPPRREYIPDPRGPSYVTPPGSRVDYHVRRRMAGPTTDREY